jgi:hypothetical protein
MRGQAGNWKAVSIGVRYTLTEAAQIIGISRESLRRNYAWKGENAKPLPDGFQILKEEGGRTLFLLRTK